MPGDKQDYIKVLSVDGGGIKGIIPAMVLAEMEDRSNVRIAEMFDLIAGTSAGGIIALGLNVKDSNGCPTHSAKEIIKFFTDDGHKIFNRSLWKRLRSVGGLRDEKYDHEELVRILKKYMGDSTLGSCITETLISSYDIKNRCTQFFKSWKLEHQDYKMWELSRATSAAPTYFEPIELDGAVLVDGGVFANNPAMCAYAEVKKLQADPKQKQFCSEMPILLVSLGTGEHTRPISYMEARDWGTIEWIRPILNVVFDGVSDAVDYQLKLVRGDGDEFYRFQTKLDKAYDDMDDASMTNVNALKKKAKELISSKGEDIEKICEIIK